MNKKLSRSLVAGATALAVGFGGAAVAPTATAQLPTINLPAESSKVPALPATPTLQALDLNTASALVTLFSVLGTVAWIARLAYEYNFLVAHGTIKAPRIDGYPASSSELQGLLKF